jgi:Na+-transporting NADH:ubiquinone oxidoreductase subunit NqrB
MARGARPDPRVYQSAILFGLLLYGGLVLDFDVTAGRTALLVASAIATQWACSRLGRRRFDSLSPLISAFSLALLLRTSDWRLAAAAAVIAIGSKFAVRHHGKHLFNPTNLALVVLLLLTDRVWVSPGQWGSLAWFAFLMACLGGLVVTRAARADVTLGFLATFVALQIGRAAWLGDPIAIPLHRLENGGLLLFAFFMISDPKTTPDSRTGRLLFAALVAAGAHYVQFRLFRTNGLLWSLALCALVVPILDWRFPGERYAWARPATQLSTRNRKPATANPQPVEVPNAPLCIPHSTGRVSLGIR